MRGSWDASADRGWGAGEPSPPINGCRAHVGSLLRGACGSRRTPLRQAGEARFDRIPTTAQLANPPRPASDPSFRVSGGRDTTADWRFDGAAVQGCGRGHTVPVVVRREARGPIWIRTANDRAQ